MRWSLNFRDCLILSLLLFGGFRGAQSLVPQIAHWNGCFIYTVGRNRGNSANRPLPIITNSFARAVMKGLFCGTENSCHLQLEERVEVANGEFRDEEGDLVLESDVSDIEVMGSENDVRLSRDMQALGGGMLTANATIILPFSSEIAFDAFADLTRQPSWSPWLRSVTYVDRGGEVDRSDTSRRETEWRLRFRGLKLSWRAKNTKLDRPNEICWVSSSGVRNYGNVVFESLEGQHSKHSNDDKAKELGTSIVSGKENLGESCKMTLTMSVKAPRPLETVFRKVSILETVFRKTILMGTLKNFRDVVVEEDILS